MPGTEVITDINRYGAITIAAVMMVVPVVMLMDIMNMEEAEGMDAAITGGSLMLEVRR
jgi:hypothetical protein